ncbi:hypothetical protein L596_030282 [Steinernema carpocapsae]|uniref:Uncharacterized protein n=1 Tax=Steinernema carpocapsae TaxID=34508 RepID=A0A4U5LNX2_STECR|nr:hypothetical protein L596_030282 [Steinernema carpocapsae]
MQSSRTTIKDRPESSASPGPPNTLQARAIRAFRVRAHRAFGPGPGLSLASGRPVHKTALNSLFSTYKR